MAISFDRPKHGWEGLNSGGEIYGSSDSNKQTSNNVNSIVVDERYIEKLRKEGKVLEAHRLTRILNNAQSSDISVKKIVQ